MAALLTTIGSFITSAFTWAGSVVTFITAEGHELILLFIITSFVGLGIGLVRRMIRL